MKWELQGVEFSTTVVVLGPVVADRGLSLAPRVAIALSSEGNGWSCPRETWLIVYMSGWVPWRRSKIRGKLRMHVGALTCQQNETK